MPTLRWLTRDQDVRAAEKVPYRLLEEVPELGYGDRDTGNMLIQGDNLDALKSLLPFYAGQVKCIYIDPPYNTKSAISDHYDDNLEHSQWLAMMFPRLELLRELLAEDGSIWVSIDDREAHYLKVIMDEVFGRRNLVNHVAAKMKLGAGASGGGEDKRLRKNIEHLLIYAKDYEGSSGLKRFNEFFVEEDLFELIEEMEEAGKSWKYTSVVEGWGKQVDERVVFDGAGEEILVKKFVGLRRTTVRKLSDGDHEKERQVYVDHFASIFSDTNAQTSIRTRIMDEFVSLADDEILEATYVPRSGRDKGKSVSHYYISPTIRRVIWLKDSAEKKGNRIVKKEPLGTYWDGFSLNNLTKEGGVLFPQSKKPEGLLHRIIHLATNPGDIVLDSFLGSGTTAAVAQKMGRRFIGIEMGDHAVTHCQPRLAKVVDGEQGGISKAQNWKGGGGFRFFRLGAPVFDETGGLQPDIRFPTLAAHIWFSETARPWNAPATPSPFLGALDGKGIALLYNGILGDKSINGGNVLNRQTLRVIREAAGEFAGPLTVYGERTVLSEASLEAEGLTFKQTPYDVRARK